MISSRVNTFEIQSIFSAIKINSRKYEMNLNAFELGRQCYIDCLNRNSISNGEKFEEQKIQNSDSFNQGNLG